MSIFEEKAKESEILKELHESNAVCACGCPQADHENYGEDGEACEHEDHQCVRTNVAVLSMLQQLRHEVSEATRTHQALVTALRDLLEWAESADSQLEGEFSTGRWEEPSEFAVARAALAAVSLVPQEPMK